MLWGIGLAFGLALVCTAGRAELFLGSARAIVVDEETGEVLLQKDARAVAPMGSLVKLMTAMVVLDAQQDASEGVRIDPVVADRLKRTRGGVPIGVVVSRATLLSLALIASDNRAASALAHRYPGGIDAFQTAMRQKIRSLGLDSTFIEEPTGLSPNNMTSAQDMAKILRATTGYPELSEITSRRSYSAVVNGRRWVVRNTNRLVGAPGWDILLSKTGFTNEAGRCLSMRLRVAGRTVVVVLMGAGSSSTRTLDSLNIRLWLENRPLLAFIRARTGDLRHCRACAATRAAPVHHRPSASA